MEGLWVVGHGSEMNRELGFVVEVAGRGVWQGYAWREIRRGGILRRHVGMFVSSFAYLLSVQ